MKHIEKTSKTEPQLCSPMLAQATGKSTSGYHKKHIVEDGIKAS